MCTGYFHRSLKGAYCASRTLTYGLSRTVIPNLYGTRDRFCGRQFFQRAGAGVGLAFQMIQAHYMYCALYFYYYISSPSDHQALDPRDWGPLP